MKEMMAYYQNKNIDKKFGRSMSIYIFKIWFEVLEIKGKLLGISLIFIFIRGTATLFIFECKRGYVFYNLHNCKFREMICKWDSYCNVQMP